MDFVVAGLGLGALIVVVGFVVRDLGPLLWRFISHRSSDVESPERELWNGLCQSISMVLTIAGAVILLATVVSVAAGISDHLGSRVVIIVSVAAVLAAAVLLALNVRDYRAELGLLPSAELAFGRTGRRQFSTSMTTSVSTNSLDSVRPVRKPEKSVVVVEAPAADALSAEEHDPHLNEPFDATRLLASEFDHHDNVQQSEVASGVSPEVVSVKSDVEEIAIVPVQEIAPVVAEPEIEPIANDRSEPKPKARLTLVKPELAEDTVVSSVFRSPLLADIGLAADSSANGFESSLLADVEVSADDHTAEFVSPLFADLAAADADVSDESRDSDQLDTATDAEDEEDEPIARKR